MAKIPAKGGEEMTDKKPKFPKCEELGARRSPRTNRLWEFPALSINVAFSPEEMFVIEQVLSKTENNVPDQYRISCEKQTLELEKAKEQIGRITRFSDEQHKQLQEAGERIAQLEKEVALLQDVEVHLQVCENNKKALVDICEQYKEKET